MSEHEINPVQIPHRSNATFKFLPPCAQCTVKCPGYARGGMLKFQIDRRINRDLKVVMQMPKKSRKRKNTHNKTDQRNILLNCERNQWGESVRAKTFFPPVLPPPRPPPRFPARPILVPRAYDLFCQRWDRRALVSAITGCRKIHDIR